MTIVEHSPILIWTSNNSKLAVYDSVLYIISDSDTRKITNILYFLNNKHLLIFNSGDANSIIFIKKVE